MAEGYAHATGRPGRGHGDQRPGGHQHRHAAVRRLHGLDPDGRASPARCRTPAIGTDAFQECDTDRHHPVGHQAQRAGHRRPQDIPRVVREAFHIATTGRPGPGAGRHPQGHRRPEEPQLGHGVVLADRRRGRDGLPGYKPTTKGHPAHDQGGGRAHRSSRERPVIYAGGGILKARAAEALRELAELTGIHVVTTLMARGAFPDDHPLCLGMPGMHGNYTAVTSMQKADLLIALGSRFDDRVTGKVGDFAPDAKIIHVDIDPAELGKVRRPDVPDRRRLPPRHRGAGQGRRATSGGAEAQPDRTDVEAARSAAGRRRYPLTYEQSEDGEAAQAAVRARAAARLDARRHASSCRASASTRCGRASTGGSTTPTRG